MTPVEYDTPRSRYLRVTPAADLGAIPLTPGVARRRVDLRA